MTLPQTTIETVRSALRAEGLNPVLRVLNPGNGDIPQPAAFPDAHYIEFGGYPFGKRDERNEELDAKRNKVQKMLGGMTVTKDGIYVAKPTPTDAAADTPKEEAVTIHAEAPETLEADGAAREANSQPAPDASLSKSAADDLIATASVDATPVICLICGAPFATQAEALVHAEREHPAPPVEPLPEITPENAATEKVSEPLPECKHDDGAIMWNPYNHVYQCHKCGLQFLPAVNAPATLSTEHAKPRIEAKDLIQSYRLNQTEVAKHAEDELQRYRNEGWIIIGFAAAIQTDDMMPVYWRVVTLERTV